MKQTKSFPLPLLLCLLFGLYIGDAFAENNSDPVGEWQFVVAPYMLFPSITGDTSIGRVDGAEIDVDSGDIFSALELGGMIFIEARHASGFGASLNYAFMDLGEDASGPAGFANFDADIFQGTLEGYLSYRFETEEGPVETYSGVRWWDIDVDVSATGPRGNAVDVGRGGSWVDPVIGLKWVPQIAENWHFIIQGDVGGFDLASTITWNVQSGFRWDAWDNTSLIFQYRYLSVDYDDGERGTPDRFAYDTVTQGPLIGVAFWF